MYLPARAVTNRTLAMLRTVLLCSACAAPLTQMGNIGESDLPEEQYKHQPLVVRTELMVQQRVQKPGHLQLQPAPVQQTCFETKWSVPDTLRGPEGARVYVETPEIVRMDDSLLLVGSPTLVSDSTGTLIRDSGGTAPPRLYAGFRFALLRRQPGQVLGTLMPLPEGTSVLRTVRAAIDDSGVLGILYSSRRDQEESSSPFETVWAATFDRGSWSRPTTVFTPVHRVHWIGSRISIVARDALPNVIAVPVAAIDSLRLLRFEAGRWSLATEAFPSHVYSTIAMAPLQDSALVVAYVRAGAPGRSNELFVTRSLDGGRSWRSPVKLTGPHSKPAHHSRLVQIGRTLAVAWVEWDGGNGPASELHLASSLDAGSSWQEAPSIALRTMPADLRMAAEPSGLIHVVMDGASLAPGTPQHFSWDGTRWRLNGPPAGNGTTLPSPTIAAVTSDTVIMVWGVARGQGTAPFTLMSVGRRACTL